MNKETASDPLAILKATPIPELSAEEELARRARIVARIEELRAQVSAESSAAPGGALRPSLTEGMPVAGMAKTTAGVTKLPLMKPRRSSVALTAATLALAAGLVLWLRTETTEPWLRITSGELLVQTSHGVQRFGSDGAWTPDEDVVVATDDREATLTLPSRTSVHFGRSARAEIQRAGATAGAGRSGGSEVPRDPSGGPRELAVESVRLERGVLTVSRAQSDVVQEVRVFTEQADVVMRGTLFAVMIDRSTENHGVTRVVVQEGEVNVRAGGQQRKLAAGQSWSSDDSVNQGVAEAASPATTPAVEVQAVAGATDAGPDAPLRGGTKVSSSLAEQNRAFEQAQAARRNGHAEDALRLFEVLWRKFPGSEQAHNARVEHFRLLRVLGRNEQARRSAEAYLRSYPRGFAAAEARRLTR